MSSLSLCVLRQVIQALANRCLEREPPLYRCIGADAHRFTGAAKCDNPTVRGDRLEQIVWDQVRVLLEEPSRVAEEYRRRISQAHDAPAPSQEIARIERQMTALERGIERLIDIYTSGLIDKAEFESRLAGRERHPAHYRTEAALGAAQQTQARGS